MSCGIDVDTIIMSEEKTRNVLKTALGNESIQKVAYEGLYATTEEDASRFLEKSLDSTGM